MLRRCLIIVGTKIYTKLHKDVKECLSKVAYNGKTEKPGKVIVLMYCVILAVR